MDGKKNQSLILYKSEHMYMFKNHLIWKTGAFPDETFETQSLHLTGTCLAVAAVLQNQTLCERSSPGPGETNDQLINF